MRGEPAEGCERSLCLARVRHRCRRKQNYVFSRYRLGLYPVSLTMVLCRRQSKGSKSRKSEVASHWNMHHHHVPGNLP